MMKFIVLLLSIALIGCAADSFSLPDAPTNQFHASWAGNHSEDIAIVWHTIRTDFEPAIEYWVQGSADTTTVVESMKKSTGTPEGTYRQAVMVHLEPDTLYEVKVQEDTDKWSQVYEIRSAPQGRSSFSFGFVADTGLHDRVDGLTNGTVRVIQELGEKMNPLFVLLCGDYVYYRTDKRFGSLNTHIDRWFGQMQPIFENSVIMATYGNHEGVHFLGENIDTWKSRFAHPSGTWDDLFYSFDVGSVHFISVYAIQEHYGIPDIGLDWLLADLEATSQRSDIDWIIPFYHVSPFSDGSSHPTNKVLRAQLGPIWEKYGVRVVLNAHDQNYERTLPLLDVEEDTYTVSTQELECYDKKTKGTIYLKTSSGGKLSNKNNMYSKFQTYPAPDYTAVRDDTHHHILDVHVEESGDLVVSAKGISGYMDEDAIEIETFRYLLHNVCE